MQKDKEADLKELLQKQTETLCKVSEAVAEVSKSVAEADEFRTKKSALWDDMRNVKTRLNDIEYVIKGDGLKEKGMYQTQETNFNTLFDKTKEQAGESKLLKEKHMAIESFCSSLGRRVGVLEKRTDITENKISVFEEFLNKVNFLVGSIKILWIVFGAIITSAIPVVIKHIINLFN